MANKAGQAAAGSAADVFAALGTGKKTKESGKKRINVEVSDEEFKSMKALAALKNETITKELCDLIEQYIADNQDLLKEFDKLATQLQKDADKINAKKGK